MILLYYYLGCGLFFLALNMCLKNQRIEDFKIPILFLLALGTIVLWPVVFGNLLWENLML